MAKRDNYIFILGGGGARGSYEIGVWKALREENFSFCAAAGTSVGALNAALVAQGDYDLAEEIWSKIKLNNVVDVPEDLIKDGKLDLSVGNLRKTQPVSRVLQKGLFLDPQPLKKLLSNYINEDLIRKRKFDLGLVTFNLSDLKPVEIFLDQMQPGLLNDYLLASASMPVFKSTEIGGKKFLDGGVYDNVPYSMMKNRGYRRFVVADISGLGNTKRPDIVGTETIYIKNSVDLDGMLDFGPKTLQRYQLLGYLDTKKVFGKNTGLKYFLQPDKGLFKKLESFFTNPEILSIAEEYGGKAAGSDIRNLLPPEYRKQKDIAPAFLECAALALDLERTALYKPDELLGLVAQKRRQIEKNIPQIEKPHFQGFFSSLEKKIGSINPEKEFSNFCSQEYFKAVEIFTGTTGMSLEKKALFKLYPELPAAQLVFRLHEKIMP